MSDPDVTDLADDPDLLPLEVEEFLTWLAAERGRSATTLAAYRRDLRGAGALAADAGPAPRRRREPDLEAYVGRPAAGAGWRRPRWRGRWSPCGRCTASWPRRAGSPSDPGADVEAPRVPAGLPKALTEDESALLDAVVGDDPVARRDRAILEVLYGTGLRISELSGLSLGDLDLESALLRAFGKGSKERVVPVGRHAIAALVDWLAAGGRPRSTPSGGPGGATPRPSSSTSGAGASPARAPGVVRRRGDRSGSATA